MTAGTEIAAWYLALVAEVKSRSTAFSSNCFADPQLIEQWAASGDLSVIQSPGAVLLLRRGFGVTHLYHVAAHAAALRSALLRLDPARMTEPLSADLVGYPPAIEELQRTYTACGFTAYRCLWRMIHTGPPLCSPAVTTVPVHEAVESHAGEVRAFLAGLLDPLSEQLPAVDDIAAAARQGRVLTVREAGSIVGVLIFHLVGQSSTLRYWFVSPAVRHKGVGSSLMRAYFSRVTGARRIVLWVFSHNHDAIATYQKYGFKIDGLRDWIMLKKPQERLHENGC